jgi:DNA-binding beta-propeller fold protein YncE
LRKEQSRYRASSGRLGWLLATLVFASASPAAPRLEHQATISLPSIETQPAQPVSVTTDAAGEFCVTDGTTASGFVFDRQTIPVFNTTAAAQLASPEDITSLETGGFVCTDGLRNGGRTIRCLNFFGEPVPYDPEKPQGGWAPDHILVTRDGNFVTTDPALGLIAKHDARTGALLWKRFVESDTSREITGLGRPAEAPDGRLYLPLGAAKSIAVLSSDGENQGSFGAPGTGFGRLSFPVGVAFCADGNVAVLDRMRAVVLVYDPQNAFLAEFGQFGGEATDLYHPVAIAAAPDGRIYVAQGFLGRVHVFGYSTAGASISGTTNPSRLAEAGGLRTAHPYLEGEGCL